MYAVMLCIPGKANQNTQSIAEMKIKKERNNQKKEIQINESNDIKKLTNEIDDNNNKCFFMRSKTLRSAFSHHISIFFSLL